MTDQVSVAVCDSDGNILWTTTCPAEMADAQASEAGTFIVPCSPKVGIVLVQAVMENVGKPTKDQVGKPIEVAITKDGPELVVTAAGKERDDAEALEAIVALPVFEEELILEALEP